MKLKTLWITAALVSLLAIVALSLALNAAGNTQDEIIALEKRRSETLQLAARMRQSTEDLTRMARNFAVTGDRRYEELYLRIVSVRDGKQPWPPGDAAVYWDVLAAGGAPPKGEGETLALADALERAKLPGSEQSLLQRTRSAQETLARLERQALAAMKGQAAGTESPPGQPDPVHALKILYGAEYWNRILDLDPMVEWGAIAAHDMRLLQRADTPAEAFELLKTHLTTHHIEPPTAQEMKAPGIAKTRS